MLYREEVSRILLRRNSTFLDKMGSSAWSEEPLGGWTLKFPVKIVGPPAQRRSLGAIADKQQTRLPPAPTHDANSSGLTYEMTT